MKITVKFPRHVLRDEAMRHQGLNPKTHALKPGTRVERDRKAAMKRGHLKHKNSGYF